MNMFLLMVSTGIQLSNTRQRWALYTPELNLLICAISIFILITFLTMVLVNGIYPSIKIFPMFMHPKYPVYYVIYNSAFIVLISYLFSQAWILYILITMAIINLIVLLNYSPYHEKIHNLTIVYNQVVIILALGLYIYE